MSSAPILFLKRWLKDPLKDRRHRAQQPRIGGGDGASGSADSQDLVRRARRRNRVITQALLEAGIGPRPPHRRGARRGPPRPSREALSRGEDPAGDAADLAGLLRPLGITRACAVVSGLPLLACAIPCAIASSRKLRAARTGRAVHSITYGLASPIPARKLGVEGEVKSRVLNNLPPASVWLYHRPTATAA